MKVLDEVSVDLVANGIGLLGFFEVGEGVGKQKTGRKNNGKGSDWVELKRPRSLRGSGNYLAGLATIPA